MNSPRCAAFFAAIAAVSAASAQAPAQPDPSRDPDEVLAEYVGKRGLPGAACLVLADGKKVYEGVAGVRRRGSPDPVLLGDAFHLGSDTKAMTALLAGMMVDEGKLGWRSTIGEVLGPAARMRPEYGGVTLEELLSHRSGIADALPALRWLEFYWRDRDPSRQAARMAEAALGMKPRSPAGTAYLYSNFNYVIASLMIEKASGRSWEDLMRDRLFRPLGMAGSGFGPPPAVWGHGPEASDPSSRWADNPPGLDAAGRVHATLADLEAYFRLYFDRGRGPGGEVLVSEATLGEIERPRSEGYALGWGCGATKEGLRILFHDGSNTRFYCSMFLIPEKGFAVAVLANRGDSGAGTLVQELLGYFVARYLPKDIR